MASSFLILKFPRREGGRRRETETTEEKDLMCVYVFAHVLLKDSQSCSPMSLFQTEQPDGTNTGAAVDVIALSLYILYDLQVSNMNELQRTSDPSDSVMVLQEQWD